MKSSFARYPSLAHRVVLVTGGASGIGASIVAHFVEQAAKVAFLDVDRGSGEALASKLAGHGPDDPLFVAVDLCDIVALQTAIERVRSHFGPIGVLVNNAANDHRHDMDGVTAAIWDARIAVNLRHAFFAAQAVSPGMIARWQRLDHQFRLDQLDDPGRHARLHRRARRPCTACRARSRATSARMASASIRWCRAG